MDGITLAKICDDECRARGISKAQFYTVNEVYRHLAAQDANDDINSMKKYFQNMVK